MPIQIPTVQTGLEASIQAAAQKAGKNLKINLGTNSRSVEALSQPLGRITGKADEFTKSMEAANARVLAFGASVGVLSAITRGFRELVRTTIEVEKSLANINTILNSLKKFYKNHEFVKILKKNTLISTNHVINSNNCMISVCETKQKNKFIILSAIDNLIKGGAGQAIQNLNLMFNFNNKMGLK